jgi:hypothetical protein
VRGQSLEFKQKSTATYPEGATFMNAKKELITFPPGATVTHEIGETLIPVGPMVMKSETVSNIFVQDDALQESVASKNNPPKQSIEYSLGMDIEFRDKATVLFEEDSSVIIDYVPQSILKGTSLVLQKGQRIIFQTPAKIQFKESVLVTETKPEISIIKKSEISKGTVKPFLPGASIKMKELTIIEFQSDTLIYNSANEETLIPAGTTQVFKPPQQIIFKLPSTIKFKNEVSVIEQADVIKEKKSQIQYQKNEQVSYSSGTILDFKTPTVIVWDKDLTIKYTKDSEIISPEGKKTVI